MGSMSVLYGLIMVVVSLLGRTRMTTVIMPMVRIRVRDSYASIVMRCPNTGTASMGVVL